MSARFCWKALRSSFSNWDDSHGTGSESVRLLAMRASANQGLQLSRCRATFLSHCPPVVARVPVELGATRAFLAVVSGGAHPDKSVVWSVSGPSCPLLCGSVGAGGNYTAPQILPASPNVTLTARSVADSSRQVSTSITIRSNFLLQLHQRPGLAVVARGCRAAGGYQLCGADTARTVAGKQGLSNREL
jgi:hypothetical protein